MLVFRGVCPYLFPMGFVLPDKKKRKNERSRAGNQQIDQMHALGPLQSCSRLQRLHEVGHVMGT